MFIGSTDLMCGSCLTCITTFLARDSTELLNGGSLILAATKKRMAGMMWIDTIITAMIFSIREDNFSRRGAGIIGGGDGCMASSIYTVKVYYSKSVTFILKIDNINGLNSHSNRNTHIRLKELCWTFVSMPFSRSSIKQVGC